MGTMRWQKERAESEERARLNVEFKRQRVAADDELAEDGRPPTNAPTQHR